MSRSNLHRCLGLFLLIALPGLAATRQVPDAQIAEDEQLFRSTLPIDGKLLLEFFHKLTLSDADRQRIGALIARLDEASFKERDLATKQLTAEGARALPLLYQAMPGATLERKKRLERCIQAVERANWHDVIAASARLLAWHRPQGATSALLAYLPFAHAEVSDELIVALCTVAAKDGKIDAVVLAALESPDVGKRAAAAVVVGAHGTADQRTALQRLLDDASPWVRCAAAQALLASRDRTAVPVLVGLLKHAAVELAETAEGLLLDIAGPAAPKVDWQDTKEGRTKCFAAWLAWWHQHKDKLDLARVEMSPLPLGGARLAKQTALKFMNAMGGRDAATLKKTAAVPFQWGDGQVVETEEELLRKLIEGAGASKEELAQLKFTRVVPVRVFAQVANAESKKYLDSLQGGTFYAVCWDATALMPGMEFALVVRVRGDQARVVGVARTASAADKK